MLRLGVLDLGIGRAPGSDQLTARALASGGLLGVGTGGRVRR